MIDRKNAESIQEILRLGVDTPFWKTICEAIDDSIAHLQSEQDGDSIKDLPAEQYKLEVELLKAKRRYLNHLKNLPKSLSEFLTEPPANTEKEKNYDPFYNEKELKKALSPTDEA